MSVTVCHHSSLKFFSLFLSLTTHPPHPQCPFLHRRLRLSLGCFELPPPPFYWFIFLLWPEASQRCGVLHACPVFLLTHSPEEEVLVAGGEPPPPPPAPRLQPFCSVNPHCLVVLFELTWMLLFGFSACGFFFLLLVQKTWCSILLKANRCSPVSSLNCQ